MATSPPTPPPSHHHSLSSNTASAFASLAGTAASITTGAAPTKPERPMSAMYHARTTSNTRRTRSSSRMSQGSKTAASRMSDDDGGKTAVKVAVRIRPPLQAEDPGYDLIPQRFRGSICHSTSPTTLAVQSQQGTKAFVFDRVFGEDTVQDNVWDYLKASVDSFVEGYNVSILAYGQSGSGKSFTMGTSGPTEQNDAALMGVVPRAAAALFERLNGTTSSSTAPRSGIRAPKRMSMNNIPTLTKAGAAAASNSNWSLKATYVEIYNEQLRDLLVPEHVPAQERNQVTIREDTKGRIILTGLQQTTINSVDELLDTLNFGSSIRQTDATAINARSSRSHAVFSLNLIQKRPAQTSRADKRRSMPVDSSTGGESIVTIDSKLHFVDLAGSERLKNTGAQGERAKEGISINAGLASLGKVISQLSTRSAGAHVSYRDSRLTRLLQDSLGGNAITYMVACVTPAEFHLSETLNTVQYAQRARAIQSKPQIQQTSDDADKQAVIDRLRAEINFLREQIRSSERSAPRGRVAQEANVEREREMESKLLDIQENYGALSQRHAKLIAELARARPSESTEAEMSTLKEAVGGSALDRLKRSNSFAEAVEQVVLEYEKTIESLESNLSSTRSTLSTSESSLLEKETRIAYLETVSQQLQARIQKSIDRETTSETYLRDLEAKIDMTASGDEKNQLLIADLRKELTRVRESEHSAEDYISTLEERLADAEQDHETMRREIDRLEHVVDRQRSIGKLDNLLLELDGLKKKDVVAAKDEKAETSPEPQTNGARSATPDSKRPATGDSELSEQTASSEASEAAKSHTGAFVDVVDEQSIAGDNEVTPMPSMADLHNARGVAGEGVTQSPAQARYVADKLENVTNELFELRVEHEGTVADYDALHRKYQIALNTLAEMQDLVDQSHGHVAGDGDHSLAAANDAMGFLGDPSTQQHAQQASEPLAAGSHAATEQKEGGEEQQSSSRSLSAELSSAGEAPVGTTTSTEEAVAPVAAAEVAEGETKIHETVLDVPAKDEAEEEAATPIANQTMQHAEEATESPNTAKKRRSRTHVARLSLASVEEADITVSKTAALAAELETLKASYAEKDAQLTELVSHNEQLEVHVEELKSEIQRKATLSPRPETPSQLIRRKTSQNNIVGPGDRGTDRAIRAFASLRNAAVEHLEDKPELRQGFEANLQTVQMELHNRMERTQSLEAEVAAIRKEMDMKTQMIAGLSRERSSIRSPMTPVDGGMLASMRDQLVESENTIRSLHEQHAAREQELSAQLDELRSGSTSEPKTPVTPIVEVSGPQDEKTRDGSQPASHAEIARLQSEVEAWEAKHNTAVSGMEASERHLRETVVELERSLAQHKAAAAAAMAATATAAVLSPTGTGATAGAVQKEQQAEVQAALDQERSKHRDVVNILYKQIEDHKQAAASQTTRLNELEAAHTQVVASVEADAKTRELSEKELQNHRNLITNLENQLHAHKSSIEMHQRTLDNLQASHARDIEKLGTAARRAEIEANERLDAQATGHNEALSSLRTELTNAHLEMSTLLDAASRALGENIEASQLHDRVQAVMQRHKVTQLQNSTLEKKMIELKSINEETMRELEKMGEKEKKSARLVEELEEQLNSNFEEHKETTRRLSDMQSASTKVKADMERELEMHRLRVTQLENQLGESRRGSTQRQSLDPRDANGGGSLRKSASHTSLPSPPPAIPLPPLPNSTGVSPGASPNLSTPLRSEFPGPVLPNAGANGATSPPPTRGSITAEQQRATQQLVDDQETRIRTLEKHLFAEKQLTATLEEALVDLETSSTRLKHEGVDWRKRYEALDEEFGKLKREREKGNRTSVQQVEEAERRREEAERAKRALEERMKGLNEAGYGGAVGSGQSGREKKKKGSLSCF